MDRTARPAPRCSGRLRLTVCRHRSSSYDARPNTALLAEHADRHGGCRRNLKCDLQTSSGYHPRPARSPGSSGFSRGVTASPSLIWGGAGYAADGGPPFALITGRTPTTPVLKPWGRWCSSGSANLCRLLLIAQRWWMAHQFRRLTSADTATQQRVALNHRCVFS